MGRARITMEPINNEKSRNTTFQKRKTGLKKKMYEFSTLCGIDACMIIYGPSRDGSPVEPDTWPSDPSEVRRIIYQYRAKPEESSGKRNLDLTNYFVDRQRKVEDEIAKARKENLKAKYPVWDDRLDCMSFNQLEAVVGLINRKLDSVKLGVEVLKKRKFLMEDVKPVITGCSNAQSSHGLSNDHVPSFLQRKMEFETIQPQPTYVNPLDYQVPIRFPSDHHPTPVARYPMMMANDEDYSRFVGASSSNIQYTQLTAPCYQDPRMMGMMDNMMYIPRTSMCYHTPSMQAMQPFVQHSMASSATQMYAPPQIDCKDFCDWETRNKRARQ